VARTWPGNTTADYLAAPAVATWNFNATVCLMVVARLTGYRSTASSEHILAFGLAGTRGYTLAMWDGDSNVSGPNGMLQFVKVAVAAVNGTSTTALATGTWYGLMGVGINNGNVTLKRYDLAADSLASETITDTHATNVPSTDPGTLGQWLAQSAANNSWYGDIQRALLATGTPTDAEFKTWSKEGVLPTSVTVKGAWEVLGLSPEVDRSGNGNNLTVNGTTISLGPYDRDLLLNRCGVC
jgi:hypothetical protein